MRIYKTTYSYKGKQKTCKTWYLEFEDHLGLKHTIAADTNKDVAQGYANKIQQIVKHKKLSERPSLDLINWLVKECPEKLRDKMYEFNIIREQDIRAGKPLAEQIKDFGSFIKSSKSKTYSDMMQHRVERIIKTAGLKNWQDITEDAVRQCVSGLNTEGNKHKTTKAISEYSQKHYLRAIKMFCRWAAVKANIIQRSPLEGMKIGKPIEVRHQRRVLTAEQLTSFLQAVKGFKTRYYMTGHERYLCYRLAAESGLRASELRSLKVSDFDLKSCHVSLVAGYTKNKKPCTLPLRSSLVVELKEHLNNKAPQTTVFNMPLQVARMIEDDLTEAKIDYSNDDGIYDFHSLRHQFGTMLAQAGVHPKTAMSLMRHSDINLTMKLYTHQIVGDEAIAIESLPDLSKVKQVNEKAG